MIPRFGPPLTVLLLAGPVLFGLIGTVLPALGFLPVLGGTDISLRHFADFLSRPGMGMSMGLSLGAGVASAMLSLGVVMLFVASWAGTRAFARIQHLISPLLSVPHAAAAFGLAFLIAPSGMLARLVSPELTGWTRPPDVLIVNDPMGLSMIAGLVVKEIPFLLLVTLAALPQVKLTETRALAASLGYGRIAGFICLAWPPVYRQIRLAVFAVVAFASSVVDVAVILGPTTPPTLAVRLVEMMSDPELSMRYTASAGAVVQFGVTLAAIAIWIVFERIGRMLREWLGAHGRRLRRDRVPRQMALGAMILSAAPIFAGLATLALWSVAGLWQFPDALPREVTLRTWMSAAPRVASPLATTLIVAVGATLIAVVLAMMCLVREDRTGKRAGRGALFLIYLPLIMPQVTFLFGLQLLFLVTDTIASLSALILAHLVFVLPYVFLSLSDPWRAFDRRYEAVAAGLGKSANRTLWAVRLPMLMRTALVAAAVGFAVSIGQYLPTVLVGAGRLPTITTESVALASGGNRRVVGVYAFLQMLLPLLGFAIATLLPAMIFRHRRAMRV